MSALALRNCSICSIVCSRVSFMSITILVMINPLLNSTSECSRHAHSSLEMRPSFRLIPRWIWLGGSKLSEYVTLIHSHAYDRALYARVKIQSAGGQF
jgi:hypothetical protein